ncbi:hypothetical protein [Escherichia phage FL38]
MLKTYFAKDICVGKRQKQPTIHENTVREYCHSINYKFLGFVDDWKGCDTRVCIMCDKGHTTHTKTIKTLVGRKTKCGLCAPNAKKSTEQVIDDIKSSLTDSEFMGFTTEEFKNVSTSKIILKCKEHGHEYHRCYSSIIGGVNTCPICNNKHKKSNDEAIQNIINALVDEKFHGFVGGAYIGAHKTKLIIECNNGHIYQPTYGHFIQGTRCPECCGTKRLTETTALDRINSVKGDHIFNGFVGGKYENIRTRLNMTCNNGHEYNIAFSDFFHGGYRCGVCSGRRNEDDAIKNIISVLGNNKFHGFCGGSYSGVETRLKITCEMGHEYTPTYSKFVQSGTRCRKCSKMGYQPIKPGTFYVQKLNKHKSLTAVKFGITNLTTQERMKNQSRVSKFDHEIFYELTLQDGQKILELENTIKEAMKGKTSYISKEDMPDGYTETVAPSELSTIMYIVKSFEKELTV